MRLPTTLSNCILKTSGGGDSAMSLGRLELESLSLEKNPKIIKSK